jgi:hypothetical protein
MRIVREISFRFLIVFVMLSLSFIALDMSRPILVNEGEITAQEVVQCLVQPISLLLEPNYEANQDLPNKDYSFSLNILLPIIVYLASIGGFLYLLIEDYKILRSFSKQNRLAKLAWTVWLIVLIMLILIPLFFGLQLIMKGFALAVVATIILLIVLWILYKLSLRRK